MTHGYGPAAQPKAFSDKVLSCQEAEDCLIPMGITSENVAKQYNISRETQDKFAAESFRRAAEAQKAGKFRSEIIPVTVKLVDPKTEEEKDFVVDSDDGIREGVTAASLAKLKPAFSKDGSTHAGNASQVSDGAAAVLLARRSVAKKLGLPILGKFVAAAVVGVPPKIMGVGPAYAIPKVLEKTGLRKEDVDFFEINEAFASQAVMSIQHIGLPFEKVNTRGGAIAMGHPLGCSAYSAMFFCLCLPMMHFSQRVPDKLRRATPSQKRRARRFSLRACASVRAWAWLLSSPTNSRASTRLTHTVS